MYNFFSLQIFYFQCWFQQTKIHRHAEFSIMLNIFPYSKESPNHFTFFVNLLFEIMITETLPLDRVRNYKTLLAAQKTIMKQFLVREGHDFFIL